MEQIINKSKSQTYQQIISEQGVKNIIKDSQIRIKNKHGEYKSRHDGWTAKYINDHDYTNEISQTQTITSQIASQIKTTEEKSNDNFSKYRYNSITFLGDDQKIIKKLMNFHFKDTSLKDIQLHFLFLLFFDFVLNYET